MRFAVGHPLAESSNILQYLEWAEARNESHSGNLGEERHLPYHPLFPQEIGPSNDERVRVRNLQSGSGGGQTQQPSHLPDRQS